eukprot:6185057-Pleurochrysis_carterae.AAC.1
MIRSFGETYERFIEQSIRDDGFANERVLQQIAQEIIQEVNEIIVYEAIFLVGESMVSTAYQSIIKDMYRETVNDLMDEIHEEIRTTEAMKDDALIKFIISN